MAWNQPDSMKAPQMAPKKSASSWMSTLLIVLGAFVAIGVIAFLLFDTDKQQKTKVVKREKKTIQEVDPHIRTNQVEEVKKEEPKPDPDILRIVERIHPGTGLPVLVTQRVVKLPPNASYMGKEFPNNPVKRPKTLYETYPENYIVGLMRTEPGFPVVNGELPDNFDEEFKARIADPVGIQEGDTDEDIAIREQMVEFKKQAAQLIADGMTPTEIILEERKEMNRIADMRCNYMRMICDLKKEGAPQQEIDDMITAANKILDKNGGTHIKFVTPFTIQKEQGVNE